MTRATGVAGTFVVFLQTLAFGTAVSAAIPEVARVPAGTVSRKNDAYPFFGSMPHFLHDTSNMTRELLHDRQVGVQLIRLEISGADVEPQDGHYNWALVDAKADAIVHEGMRILPEASQYNAPGWATGRPGNWQPVWNNPNDFGNFAGAVAVHFAQKYRATRIEIGNEINLSPMYWTNSIRPYMNPDGTGQAPYLTDAYIAVHATAPGVTVWPCISTTGVNGAQIVDVLTAHGAGYKKGYDGLDIHNYFWNSPRIRPSPDSKWAPWLVFNAFPYYENQMTRDGDPDPHLMVTEWGWSNENELPISETVRAAWIRDGLVEMMNDPHIDAETYTGIDDQQGGFWGGFTVFDANGQMLLAAYVIQALSNY